MSVINTMLRDLDRRHAPAMLPAGTRAPQTEKPRAWPRPALALCALAAIIGWNWARHLPPQVDVSSPSATVPVATPPLSNLPATTVARPNPVAPQVTDPKSILQNESHPAASRDLAEAARVADVNKPEVAAQPSPRAQNKMAPFNPSEPSNPSAQSASVAPAPKPDPDTSSRTAAPELVKQSRADPTLERYDDARALLAQGQAQPAYELLRDNPPALSAAPEYHAVLAAVEQQLGHYADAAARYRQLLQLDSTQASWWLGLALSLDGAGNGAEANISFERALALNALPVAARDYAASRVAALARASTTSQESSRGR